MPKLMKNTRRILKWRMPKTQHKYCLCHCPRFYNNEFIYMPHWERLSFAMPIAFASGQLNEKDRQTETDKERDSAAFHLP